MRSSRRPGNKRRGSSERWSAGKGGHRGSRRRARAPWATHLRLPVQLRASLAEQALGEGLEAAVHATQLREACPVGEAISRQSPICVPRTGDAAILVPATHRLQRPRRWCASPHPPPAASRRAARHGCARAPHGQPRAGPAARQAPSPLPEVGTAGGQPGPRRRVPCEEGAPPHPALALATGWLATPGPLVTLRADQHSGIGMDNTTRTSGRGLHATLGSLSSHRFRGCRRPLCNELENRLVRVLVSVL